MAEKPRLLLMIHPMDPRGAKLGGIETHVRHMLKHHPQDTNLVFVGVDEYGDLEPAKPVTITVYGRSILFVPLVREPAEAINKAATKLLRSITLRLAAACLRHLPLLRRLTRGYRASAETQRFEFAPIIRLLGLPAVQIVHGEGTRKDKMDSLIKRFWFLHAFNERLALRLARHVVGVNPTIIKRFEAEFPAVARKAEVMSVSVDTDLFAPQPFDTQDDVFRVVFAGRLDEFKDPPLMFSTFKTLHERLQGRFAFHYIGTTDPHRYAEFAAIEAFTIRHGFQNSEGVARIAATCHAGVLTSFFEGMPCYLLEMLGLGRPFIAIRLPQYDPLIVEGVSGQLIERRETPELSCEALAEAFMTLWADIKAGVVDPRAVHGLVEPYSVKRQLARLFERHRALQDGAVSALSPSDAAGAIPA